MPSNHRLATTAWQPLPSNQRLGPDPACLGRLRRRNRRRDRRRGRHRVGVPVRARRTGCAAAAAGCHSNAIPGAPRGGQVRRADVQAKLPVGVGVLLAAHLDQRQVQNPSLWLCRGPDGGWVAQGESSLGTQAGFVRLRDTREPLRHGLGPALGEQDLTFCICKYTDGSEVEPDLIKVGGFRRGGDMTFVRSAFFSLF